MLSVGNAQADSYLYIPTYLGTGYRMIIAQLLDTKSTVYSKYLHKSAAPYVVNKLDSASHRQV